MTIAVRDLDALDPDLVAAALAETTTRVAELNPGLDLRVGVLHNLVVYLHAVLGTGLQQNVLDYLNGRSLLAIQTDPALADPELVDHVLSNFRVVRKAGEAARGEVAVVKDNDLTTTYAVGAEFTAGGRTFVTERVYTAKAEAALVGGDGDRLITARADGNFVFTVPVVAVEAGGAGRVAKDTVVVPAAVPAGFVAAYAAGDFTDGADAETNDAMLLRLQQGAACKAPASRVSMTAMLREVPAFERVGAQSIVGYGDAEMLRDKHWIFPVHGGGKADWYVRTDEPLTRRVLTKTATLVAADGTVGTWQFALTRDDAPGFYEIDRVRLPGTTGSAGGFTVTADTRAVDLSGAGFRPDVRTVAEGAYTRFQTAVVQFADTVTDASVLAVGARQDYEFDVKGLPLVGEIQDYLSGRDVRAYGADVLVKAPVPCFLQVSFTVHKRASDAAPDVAAIKAAVAALANQTPFTGRLSAGRVHDVVHGFLGNEASVGSIDMFGRLRYPDGRTTYVRDADVLAVPDAPADMVSPKTVQFFLAPEDVGVTVESVVPAAL